jgi:hypothetical protein
MRYSDWEQRQMDIKSGLELDRHARKARLAKPCKNEGAAEVHPIDGSCLRCGADQGEACRSID